MGVQGGSRGNTGWKQVFQEKSEVTEGRGD